jgi:hypothetical protein
MADDVYTHTINLKRGDGHDVQKTKVTAETIEELDERVNRVIEKMESWADDYREIQPEAGRSLADDQSELSEVKA